MCQMEKVPWSCKAKAKKRPLGETRGKETLLPREEALQNYFKEKIGRAEAVIRAVEQREETLIRIAGFALSRQECFALRHGQRIRLTMRQAAEAEARAKEAEKRAEKEIQKAREELSKAEEIRREEEICSQAAKAK